MARKLKSWIDGYIEHTSNMGSPKLWCRWTAIAILAGALERKIWIKTARGFLYPNMYTILVGGAGIGKTLQTDIAWTMWERLSGEGSDTHTVSPQSVTHASLIDELRHAERKIVRPQDDPPVVSFNSLLISVNELSILLPSYDIPMMSRLTDLYDCKVYGESRRTRELKFRIEAPQLNLLSATTPSQLLTLLPEGAWEQGFLSRVILVYSGELIEFDLWDIKDVNDGSLWPALINDLEVVGNLYGAMKFTKEAADAINAWQKQKGPPQPSHPKLVNYCARRTAHLLKLCMIISVSYGDDLVVTMDHYLEALDALLEVERHMIDIFKAMASGGDIQIMRDAWHFAYEMYMRSKDKNPVPESLLIRFISEHAPVHNVQRILSVMIQVKMLTPIEVNKVGTCYIPKERKDF